MIGRAVTVNSRQLEVPGTARRSRVLPDYSASPQACRMAI